LNALLVLTPALSPRRGRKSSSSLKNQALGLLRRIQEFRKHGCANPLPGERIQVRAGLKHKLPVGWRYSIGMMSRQLVESSKFEVERSMFNFEL
jgi:hypothetical protein